MRIPCDGLGGSNSLGHRICGSGHSSVYRRLARVHAHL